jgi:hypothetical protein
MSRCASIAWSDNPNAEGDSMKRAVSISLGSPARDKTAVVDFNGTLVEIKRIGTGGDIGKAQQLFTELDGQVDALSVGGIDLYVRIDGRDYPVRNALKLIRGVQQTPLVDGRVLKYVLERQVLALAAPLLQANGLAPLPHFRRAFMPFSVDRLGLAETLAQTAGEIVFGDLIFALGIPHTYHWISPLQACRQKLDASDGIPAAVDAAPARCQR